MIRARWSVQPAMARRPPPPPPLPLVGEGWRPSRRACLQLAAASLALSWTPRARAEDVPVPIGLQVDLLAKVAGYDKNLPARVLVVSRTGNDDATRAAAQLERALADKTTIAGLPTEVATVPWSDAPSMAKACRARRASIVYFTPGLSEADATAVARAFDGVDVLSVAAMPTVVPRGIVLGFDLVGGKPKLLVHLGQARRQNVALGAEVLKLMRVYE